MKNIVVICGSLSRGGAERVSLMISNYLLKKGYKVTILTINKVKNEYDIPNNIDRICLSEEINTSNNLCRFIYCVKRLRTFIKKKDIDLMIIMGTPMCIYGIPAKIFTKTKIIVSERNDPKHFAGKKIVKYISRFLMKFADGFVFQTNDAKNFYEKSLKGRGTVIFNPILTDNLPDAYSGEREKIIVNVGRLDPQKNQKMLIDSFTRIANDIQEYKLLIYGEGNLHNELEQYISKLNMSDRILLKGNVLDLHQKIKKASAFVLSSNFEGMPNALIEAMAIGLPCISTDCSCGGPRELIKDGKNGILVPVNDDKALSEAILKVIKDDYYSNIISKNAIKIRNFLDIENIGTLWIEYIFSLL